MQNEIDKRAMEIYLNGNGDYADAYRQAEREIKLKGQVPDGLLEILKGEK